ncbi:hypothetical protein SPBR_03115 [Sporothrix brasiliensis 5110]|uniref:AB hydrolase-1 domain-containing protein n=1 Tax=Sporothrix brasiliensis 5110 TaxID=1398154 RepID=A0A0C2IVA2_9PEZI|nr:uncharacterized protein SPBR_03115 [Sporothrix brasiliensis 5110]KIH93071.1 hypothetical protein SPBR_03115 [Sporothrix brasiliensis 5110]
MATFRSEFVETGQPGVCIHVSLSETTSPAPSESAPTVVFLHFWGGSTRTWTSVPARVAAAAAGYRTASIDFRGWGLSTGPADAAAYSIAQLADDVVSVLTKLNLQRRRVVLVGVSMGAKVAQVVAYRLIAKDPTSVAAVILASPAPATALQLPKDMREQQLHAYDTPESASLVARNVLTQAFQGANEGKPLPGFVVEDMLRGNPPARAAWPAYAMGEDVTATSLSSLAAPPPPVLVLAAEMDIVEPLDRVKSGVLACIPGARLEVVAGAGHLSSIDAPEAVADAIVRFVNTATRQAAV